jgi:hypothetical protein
MLCTLLAPTGGQATVAAHDIAQHPQQVRLDIGVALQDVSLDPRQTGLELLRLQGQLYGLRKDEIDARLAELRELVDLRDALDRRIGTYSGGMRRRLDLAAALFPFLFLTSSYVPRDQLSGWLGTVAGVNPVTYLLEGMRSLAFAGWQWDELGKAFLALLGVFLGVFLVVFLVSFTLCFAALRSRGSTSADRCGSVGPAPPADRPTSRSPQGGRPPGRSSQQRRPGRAAGHERGARTHMGTTA